jgi:hypothetical protein
VTVLALIGAVLLVLGEFLDLYAVKRGVVVIQEPTGGSHHAYSLLIAGMAAIGATLLARATEAWPPGAAVAVLGVAALVVVLIGDLPDATSSGLTSDARLAHADPGVGFWVELAGAAVVCVSGATMTYLLRR